MDKDVFDIWYLSILSAGLASNCTDNELLDTCAHTETCRNCKLRGRCPLRLAFYLSDTNFEEYLQTAEIFTEGVMSRITNLDSDEPYDATNKIREKRRLELQEHPTPSYE